MVTKATPERPAMLSQLWDEFEAQILPDEMPEALHSIMQKSWYAGAFTAMQITKSLVAARSYPPEFSAAIIADVAREAEEFLGR